MDSVAETHGTSGDEALVARAQAGDRGAFDLLVRKYQQRIVKLAFRYVRDHAEALDIAQEAFIKAYRALPGFRGESAFYTWLYRIAINAAKNHLAGRDRRLVDLGSDSDDGDPLERVGLLRDDETPERLAMQGDLERVIAETVAALPDDLRAAILLREIDGLSYEEIAAAMDCPVGTVRSRIFRAREAIDERIRPLLSDADD
jgi:RNA polymerase sigma-70 factor, ECF subfamily